MLTSFLTTENFQITSVTGQKTAVEAMEAERPDLALVDISLAEGNGFAVCANAGETLQMLEGTVPPGINPFESEGPGTSGYSYYSNEAGEPILEIVPYVNLGDGRIGKDSDNRVEYLIRLETNREGKTIASYFKRDITTGAVAETPVTTEEVTAPRIRIGATIRELPFGVSFDAIESYYYNYLVLPLSAAPSDTSVDLCITVSNYTAAKTYLNATLSEYGYRNFKETKKTTVHLSC